MQISPKSINETYNENDSTIAHEISLTQLNLQNVVVSGGNSSGYQVSSEDPEISDEGYQDSITLDNQTSSFFID